MNTKDRRPESGESTGMERSSFSTAVEAGWHPCSGGLTAIVWCYLQTSQRLDDVRQRELINNHYLKETQARYVPSLSKVHRSRCYLNTLPLGAAPAWMFWKLHNLHAAIQQKLKGHRVGINHKGEEGSTMVLSELSSKYFEVCWTYFPVRTKQHWTLVPTGAGWGLDSWGTCPLNT
jgi:hypothetical protein